MSLLLSACFTVASPVNAVAAKTAPSVYTAPVTQTEGSRGAADAEHDGKCVLVTANSITCCHGDTVDRYFPKSWRRTNPEVEEKEEKEEKKEKKEKKKKKKEEKEKKKEKKKTVNLLMSAAALCGLTVCSADPAMNQHQTPLTNVSV